jgi:hypothetical protein
MKTFQRAFGIDWNENVEGDGSNDKDTVTSSAARHGVKLTRSGPPLPVPTQRNQSHDTSASNISDEESHRVAGVRSRCKAQHDALSAWWRIALQSNIQQRMWMQLGSNQAESLLPLRYERLYQPDKIAQFDRFFARGWATPVRCSHSAQHSEGASGEVEAPDLKRVLSRQAGTVESRHKSPPGERHCEKRQTLSDYVASYGLKPHVASSLTRFLEHHDGVDATIDSSLDFVGRLDTNAAPSAEYLRYVCPSIELYEGAQSYRKEAVEEFKACLHDYSLKSNDVCGIREVRTWVRFSKRFLRCARLMYSLVAGRIGSSQKNDPIGAIPWVV